MGTQHISTYSSQKHLNYKIHKMLVFLPFHSHLLSEFQHNQYYTLPFLCGNLRLFSIKCLLVLIIYLQFGGRIRIFYDNQLMHYPTSIRYLMK
jgi:hypothetical protein